MQNCLLKIGPPLTVISCEVGPWDINFYTPLISSYTLQLKRTKVRSFIMLQFSLHKRLGIRLKRSCDVICQNWHSLGAMNTHIFTSLDKAGFRKVEKGRQSQNHSISRWSWCSNRNHPRFLYVSVTLTKLIHKELCLLPLTECEWVLSSTFLFFWIITLKPNCLKVQVATNSSAMEDEGRHY